MTEFNRSRFQRLLAHEFDVRGWAYDHETPDLIREAIEAGSPATAAAQKASTLWLRRNHTTRDALAEVIERVLAKMTGGQR